MHSRGASALWRSVSCGDRPREDPRHRWRRLPRLSPRRAARGRRPRRVGGATPRLRPHVDAGHGAPLRRDDARARLPPGRGGGRHRREPGESRALLVREPDDGRARPRAGATPRDAEARDRGHGLRVSEVHAGPVSRGRALERLSRGDERPVRRREEDDPRRCPGIPRAVRDERDLPPADEPLRAGRQLRPRDVARDPRADPEDDRVTRRGRALGRRLADPRVPVRRRLRPRTCRSGRALRRARAGQPRHRRRDVDPGDRRAGRRSRRVRRVDHLGHVDAERSAAPQPRSLPRARALRLDGADASPRGDRARRSRRSAPPSREHRGTRRPVPTPAATRGAGPRVRLRREARRRRARDNRPRPDRGDRRALLLDLDERLADLPGRRPDLARDLGLAAGRGHDRLRADEPRVAAAARAAHVAHGLDVGRAPAAHDGSPGRRCSARSPRSRSTTSARGSPDGSRGSGARARSSRRRSRRSRTSSSATTTRGSTSSSRRRSG